MLGRKWKVCAGQSVTAVLLVQSRLAVHESVAECAAAAAARVVVVSGSRLKARVKQY